MNKTAIAQRPHFQEEGFPSQASEIKHVTGIAADKNNCIWFATQMGIYRYDGTRFKHYSVLNTPELKFERMQHNLLRVNNQGYSWCMVDSKGNLYEVDSLSHLQPFFSRPGSREQIIYETNSYHILDPQKERIAPSLTDIMFETYIIPSSERAFLLLSNGEIVTMAKTDFLSGGKGTLIYTIKSIIGVKTLATSKNFYIITHAGLLRWGRSLQPQAVVLAGDILTNNHKGINYDSVTALKTTEPGIILFWYNGNIYEGAESGDNMLDTRLLIKGQDKEPPSAVFYSPAQQLFISYFLNRGLIFYRPRQFSLLAWHVPGMTTNPEDYYYSLIPSNNGFITVNNAGLIWLGIDGEQLMLNKGACFKYFLSKDRTGDIWYQQMKDNLISYLQPGTGSSIPILKGDDHNALIGMYQHDDSTYYLLSNHIFRKLIVKNGVAKKTQILYSAPAGIEFNVLYALDSGILWLGSDRGLMKFAIGDNSIKNVADLDNAYVRAITKLKENNYLVGTYDKGIYQFNNGKWIHLSSAGKNMPASAHAFIIDKLTSSLWVSSNEGILRIPLQQLLQNNPGQKNNITFGHFTNFGPDISPEFNGSSNVSGAQLSDTCIAFANAKGLVVFNPLKLISYPLPVNVLAEPVNENNSDSLSKNGASPNRIEFNPVVPYFGNREDLEVLYHLTNSDDGWHKLSPGSIISYNNLNPGDHDLQFRMRNYRDPQEKEVFLTAKSFSIPYRWYQKAWFPIAAGVFILLLLVSLHYLRIWFILKRRKELEQLVNMKTSELQETNENLVNVINELSASEANLKQSNFLKDEYYAVLTHDIRSPLKFLSFNISQLLELLPRLNNEALKKGLFAAYQCSNDVYKLIDEFIYWIQDNEKQLTVQSSPTMISAVAEDAKKMYEFSLEGNKNSFVTNISSGLRFITDPKLLFIILRNAIDNANKYTADGTITISASRQDDTLQVIVSDTGRGMKEDVVQQLMDLQQKNVQLSYEQLKSLGFYIMAMLTKKLGGSYSVTSIKGQGTSLCFTIPELKEG